MSKKYPKSDKVERMKERFYNTTLREANPNGDPTQTSYTVNKGDTMVICLRAYGGQLVDLTTLMYVAIHEFAHIYSSSYHHTKEFWDNMKFLIDEAVERGLYRRVDYRKSPVKYCGIMISSNIPRVELPGIQEGRTGGKEHLLMIDGGKQKGGGFGEELVGYLLARSGIF